MARRTEVIATNCYKMSLLPSNIPANNHVPYKVINQNTTFKDPNRTAGVDALAGVEVGKGKNVPQSVLTLTMGSSYVQEAAPEMTDDVSA